MKKLFMPLITTILITPISTHAACTATPDCATLGYTATSCANGGIKCPFDTTKMFCPASRATCDVGSYLYSDMTCDYKFISDKTIIAIVGYIDGSKRVAFGIADKPGYWGDQYYYDIPGIPNIQDALLVLNDFEGRAHTTAVGGSNTSYAPQYCNVFLTEGTNKKDWYLPAAGEVYTAFYLNNLAVSTALLTAGLSILSGDYWSSSEYDNNGAWVVNSKTGKASAVNKRNGQYSTKCAIAF